MRWLALNPFYTVTLTHSTVFHRIKDAPISEIFVCSQLKYAKSLLSNYLGIEKNNNATPIISINQSFPFIILPPAYLSVSLTLCHPPSPLVQQQQYTTAAAAMDISLAPLSVCLLFPPHPFLSCPLGYLARHGSGLPKTVYRMRTFDRGRQEPSICSESRNIRSARIGTTTSSPYPLP